MIAEDRSILQIEEAWRSLEQTVYFLHETMNILMNKLIFAQKCVFFIS